MALTMLPPPTPNQAQAAQRRAAFMTPLSRGDLFDVDETFPREELLRRILSFFWRDCCCPSCFSRAPAPVIELAADNESATKSRRLRAWWLMHDGILDETEGPYSERLRPFFGGMGRNGQLWPRYEFRLTEVPLAVEMSFHQDPLSGRGHRTHLEALADGRLRVVRQEPSWRL